MRVHQLPKKVSLSFILTLFLMIGAVPETLAQTVDRSEISQWESKDSATTCDEIGWEASEILQGTPDDANLMHHLACVGSVGYLAVCGTIEGDGMFFEPSSGQNWIACYVIAGNTGSGEESVSLFDFSLVGSNGRKYTQDFTAQASLNPDSMFPTTTIREGQNVDGVIAFSVPKSNALPYFLEIDPMLNFSLTRTDPGNIVITKLVSFESLI